MRTGEAHAQLAAVELLLIEGFDCLARILVSRHVDEAEAVSASVVSIAKDMDVRHFADLSEMISQIVVFGFERQIAYVELDRHFWKATT